MPLNNERVAVLEGAIQNYSFPKEYFDFETESPVAVDCMKSVETTISRQLRAVDPRDVLRGLANVIHWGYAQIGYRDVRRHRFIAKANLLDAVSFQEIVAENKVPDLMAIKNIGLPEFSGVSFISKVLMFLDPSEYCVLDQQLSRLAVPGARRALNVLTKGQQIRVTKNNQAAYDAWRSECRAISAEYFDSMYRVVDVERGFFKLVQDGSLGLAQSIYANA